VIATDVGGAREAIEHGTNGLLVRPRDPDDIASAIRQLACDPRLRRLMSQANLTRIQRRFTWQAVARQYSAVYEHVMKQPARAAAR
jgi:glycosyltransferase involved in cell wall biosynthesis